MKKYNKQFDYKGYKFNISVELNTSAERHPNGKVWHTIITNDMGATNYYQKQNVESNELADAVINQERIAKLFVDKGEGNAEEEMLLLSMGFSKQ